MEYAADDISSQGGTIQIQFESQEEPKTIEYTNLESVPSSQFSQQYSNVGTQYLQHHQYQEFENFNLVPKNSRVHNDSPPEVLYSDPSLASARVYQVS